MPPSSRTRDIAFIALLVALLCVSVCFTIPLGPVPFTLQTAVIILTALLCGPRQALAVTCIYLLMGLVGLPVFSGMTGGLGKFLGPTGGFLISYPIGTTAAAALRIALERRGVRQIACDIIAAATIIVISDIIGWLWLMVVTATDPVSAFLAADAPFIALDCCKAVVSAIVAKAVRAGLHLQRADATGA